jgi:NACHT domain/CHAT domain
MQAGMQVVLAMGYSVTVSAAQLMMHMLYKQLFAGNDLSAAIRRARVELYNRKGRHAYFNQMVDLEDWLLPVVYQNQPQWLTVRPFTEEESKVYHERQAARYHATEPAYGFLGRDLDILQIENCLLSKRNLLLVRGMGGAGKTTLLHHLGAWWQTTHFVDQVFYFGYDERAWTCQQIIVDIAQRLLSPGEYAVNFGPLSFKAKQEMLAGCLRARRHLLIFDNLESITGSQLAVQNTLSSEEQAALRSFFAELLGGRTLVLLGSRSSEEWLAQGTFGDNVYELPGLDPEAASMLAERVLERYNVKQYQQDTNLQRLLNLLDGYPLALEVLLANLVLQTPAEILEALQAGDVALIAARVRRKPRVYCVALTTPTATSHRRHSNCSPA